VAVNAVAPRPAPTPDYRAVAVRSAQKYGINPAIFLRQIQQESGFNPHARSPAGAVGIAQIVPHWHPGVNANDPMASLDYAAKYMATLVHKYGNYQSALSVYNSGSPTGWRSIGQTSHYVNSIMGGANGAAPIGAPSPTALPRSPAAAGGFSPALIQAMSRMNAMLGMPAMPAGLLAPRGFAAATPLAPTVPFKGPASGKPIPGNDLLSIGGLHPTEGLPGYMAHDYFAHAGTPVVAPVNGKIIELSGHDPSQGPVEGVHGPFGWSVYLQGSDGHIYYMTHLGSRSVHVGQTIRGGAQLGTVGDYARYGGANHVHMGVH
jgi:Soluble lytic murein transglycosylase and related regulatory proteins (some contain LysM/invasin domains)